MFYFFCLCNITWFFFPGFFILCFHFKFSILHLVLNVSIFAFVNWTFVFSIILFFFFFYSSWFLVQDFLCVWYFCLFWMKNDHKEKWDREMIGKVGQSPLILNSTTNHTIPQRYQTKRNSERKKYISIPPTNHTFVFKKILEIK